MSMRDYPLYYQGALLASDVFDAARLIRHLLKEYEIDLSYEATEALEAGELIPVLQEELCEAFCMDDAEYESLDEFKDEMLAYNTDVFETLQPLLNQQAGVSYHHLSGVNANFYYRYEPHSESMDAANMLVFPTPLAWEPHDEKQPSSLEEAISWLNNAGELVFQDEIDWMPRLGELLGTAYG